MNIYFRLLFPILSSSSHPLKGPEEDGAFLFVQRIRLNLFSILSSNWALFSGAKQKYVYIYINNHKKEDEKEEEDDSEWEGGVSSLNNIVIQHFERWMKIERE